MGRPDGSCSAAGSMPESMGGGVPSSGPPLTSLSHATGRMEAGRLRLFRLLLLGFPDWGVERRYAQFKV